MKTGSASITRTCKDCGLSLTTAVSVVDPGVTLNRTKTLTLARGMTYQLKAYNKKAVFNGLSANEWSKLDYTWTSSATKYAKVSSKGKITAKAKGTTYIYAKDPISKSYARLKVIVVDPLAKMRRGTTVVAGKTLTLKKGKTVKLNVRLTPNVSTTKTWTTSNKSVATVTSAGVVKGIKVGYTYIYCTLASGRKTWVRIRVIK